MNEAKWLTYHLIFHPELRERSLQTIRSYHYGLRVLVAGCCEQQVTSLGDFFESDRVARKVWRSTQENFSFSQLVQVVPGLYSAFIQMGRAVAGFRVRRGDTYAEIFRQFQDRRGHYQTPVIPWQIYKQIFSSVSRRIDECIAELDDPAWKAAISFHANYMARCPDPKNSSETVKYIATNFPAFSEKVPNMRSLIMRLAAMQQLSRIGCLLYTGCRIGETESFPSDCLDDAFPGAHLIVGHTSKSMSGKVSWITNELGAQAVRLAQSIRSVAMASAPEIQKSLVPLFPVLVGLPKAIFKHRSAGFSRQVLDPKDKKTLNIALERANVSVPKLTPDDYGFLCELAKDSNINLARFSADSDFPLTSLQFRRSLAYFAMRSGGIEIGTVRRQFKQVRTFMAEYYTSGVVGDNLIPESTLAHLIDIERLAEIDERMCRHLTDYQDLSGGTGALIRRNIESQEPVDQQNVIQETRKRLLKRVEQGEIDYRETPLGACLSPDPCFPRLRAEFSKCLDCKDAVLQKSSVERVHEALISRKSSFFAAQAEHFSYYLSGTDRRGEAAPNPDVRNAEDD